MKNNIILLTGLLLLSCASTPKDSSKPFNIYVKGTQVLDSCEGEYLLITFLEKKMVKPHQFGHILRLVHKASIKFIIQRANTKKAMVNVQN